MAIRLARRLETDKALARKIKRVEKMLFALLRRDPYRDPPYGNVSCLRGYCNLFRRIPSHDHAMAFYDDPEYAALKKLRQVTTTNITVTLAKEFIAAR